MKLNRNTWHHKVWRSSYSSYRDIPRTTNLCSYCQRVFWTTLAFTLLGLMMVTMVAGMCYFVFYMGFYQHTAISFKLFGGLLMLIGAFITIRSWRRSMRYSEPGLVRQWVRAKKQRVCPLIEFDGTDDE